MTPDAGTTPGTLPRSVSIVVCTYNRADALRETLECLRRQHVGGFEVVVVNGPSTDHTVDVLAEYESQVKVRTNPLANLAISRNIGIRAAAGDVVAFVDDDALPEPCWLAQALPAFDDPEVGGVGGIVFDHDGVELQYRYSAGNRFGETTYSHETRFDDFSFPGSATFPYLQGTNALFRRDVLARVGLFDETFDFYLDETDLCCRIVDAGYVLRQLDDAPVHHKWLPSAIRNERKAIVNYYTAAKNFTYFGYRHAMRMGSTELDVLDRSRAHLDRILENTRRWEEAGDLEPGHLDGAVETCGNGFSRGVELGRELRDVELPPVELDPPPLLPYPTVPNVDRLAIVLVSSGYPPAVTGGIARFVGDVAPELARLGHDVRVITRTPDVTRVDLEDGVWVHRMRVAPTPGRLPDAPPHVDAFATAVADELDRIEPWFVPDVVYGSLWDVEMLAVQRDTDLPVVPMLATPMVEVAEHEGWVGDDGSSSTAATIARLELESVERAATVHAISEAIHATFHDLAPDAIAATRVEVAHIGRTDDGVPIEPRRPGDVPTVLFVGRLEARKGIDTFLDAAASVVVDVPTVEFVVAGDDRAEDGSTQAERWARRAIPGGDRVRFVGEVGDDELADHFASAAVVVMPSRYESFGLVAVEAMMHGRPVVAGDVGGLRELIDDGETGLLVPVGDAVALASAVSSLIDDRTAADRIGRAARARYERDLTAPAAAARLERILRSAARRAQPAGVG